MPQLNVLLAEYTQPTDFKSESLKCNDKGSQEHKDFSQMVDRHIQKEQSGNSSQDLDDSGKIVSAKEQKNAQQSDDVTTSKEKNNVDQESETSGEVNNDDEETKLSQSSEAIKQESDNEAALAANKLSEEAQKNALTHSQQFISLLNSSQQVLKGSQASGSSEDKSAAQANNVRNETATAINLTELMSEETELTEEQLAAKISQNIIKDQQNTKNDAVLGNESTSKQAVAKSSADINSSLSDNEQLQNKKESAGLINQESRVLSPQVQGTEAAINDRSSQIKNNETVIQQLNEKKQTVNQSVIESVDELTQDTAVSRQKDEALTQAALAGQAQEKLAMNKESTTAVGAINNEPVKDGTKISSENNGKYNQQAAKSADSSITNMNNQSPINDSVDLDKVIQPAVTQSKVSSPVTTSSAQTEGKVTLAEQKSLASESEQQDAQSEQNQQEQAQTMAASVEQNTAVADDKKQAQTQPINTSQTSAHFTDVSSQATKVESSESQTSTIEELSHAIVNDNMVKAKNNAAALNETISIFRKDFAEAVKDKVMVMISQKLQQFDIRLDPPELGNVHVRVNLQSEQAVVNFTVQNQQAKEAFEENLHKLKDMLSQSGVDVGDANVEQQAQQSNDDLTEQHNGQGSQTANQENEEAQTVLSADLFKSSASRVDYYA